MKKRDQTSILRLLLLLFLWGFTLLNAKAQYTEEGSNNALNKVYQYSIPLGNQQAFLWIPPDCKRVRGVIISLANLLERNWLEDPYIRKTAADEGLGIIWIGGGWDSLISPDLKDEEDSVLKKVLKDLAEVSGYQEIEYAPIISMGHSAHGQFAWTVPDRMASRTIAAIPIKTVPLPDSLEFKGVPLCYLVGQTTEWPQFRVPDPASRPGDRDFFWPVVRKSALKLRAADKDNLIGVVTDPGGGHFDWSEHQARFIALYIRKACQYRLPGKIFADRPAQLKEIKTESGWLTDAGGMDSDKFDPAPYKKYEGDPQKAYWFFDKETALAAQAFEGDRRGRKKQMLTFIQDGKPLPVAKQGFASLKFQPEQDGLTFKLQGGFLSEIPPELVGSGTPLGHAPGSIRFRVISGPAIQVDSNTFRIQFDRAGMNGEIWIQEELPANDEYRHAVQPGLMKIPVKLTKGESQEISFPQIPDQKRGIKSVKLHAVSSSGLPVNYYVIAGPAIVEGNELKFTKIPVKSKFPVKVTLVAYQWGRIAKPYYQSAVPVTQSFYIIK